MGVPHLSSISLGFPIINQLLGVPLWKNPCNVCPINQGFGINVVASQMPQPGRRLLPWHVGGQARARRTEEEATTLAGVRLSPATGLTIPVVSMVGLIKPLKIII